MKRFEKTGEKQRVAKEPAEASGTYYLHANASEGGLTLRPGEHSERRLVSATFRPHAKTHPSDRAPADAIFSCVVFSDDHFASWQVSDFFPEGYTEEAALVELHDGRIYLLFEGGSDGRYSAMQVARFNLSWILAGEPTGNGQVPEWVQTACDSCRDGRRPIFASRRALAFAGILP